MTLFPIDKKIQEGSVGIYARKHNFGAVQLIPSGIFSYFDIHNLDYFGTITVSERMLSVSDQAALTKDLITLHTTYSVRYKVSDPLKVIKKFGLPEVSQSFFIDNQYYEFLYRQAQIVARQFIAETDSEEINAKRDSFSASLTSKLQEMLEDSGLTCIDFALRDIAFPKNVQGIMARRLEAKVDAHVAMETSRTQVASARALKNAAILIRESPEITGIQQRALIEKIAGTGQHEFVLHLNPEKDISA
ncbi:MAG: SPFH domain-containing protein [Rectinemataceae bacterium]|nr:SPFH domain-containing protein [Rectinemataceae bacterium]